ncbi:nucleotide sugar dehydrogenase [Stappia sp. BW2]|uniref:nucleotide sugar dehydrogenase n=1 Tax=Stappia sp. BW2 TaxID=2592622 RepID=UPI0011DE756D|nr:nucleotide sugar dehydrogenase [Stappia sp. BW2]TYC67340.1 nucleotide sugar dehydrogenase [Stappia sp. BW2]
MGVARLLEKIDNKTSVVAVVGLGYVGIPLLATILSAGFKKCIGVDINENRIHDLLDRRPFLTPWRYDSLWSHIEAESLIVTDSFSSIREADVVVICVPTPLDQRHQPDLAPLAAAIKSVLVHSRSDQLVVIESTTYPGTTKQYLIEAAPEFGRVVGEDYFVAYSPEREDPGNINFTTKTITKVVGADDKYSRSAAELFYSKFIERVYPVSSSAVAECTKIYENAFRAVNIAFVNEMKVLLKHLDIDIWEVVEAASSKPFGFMPFLPGPGIGGHCIPIDPLYLNWKLSLLGMEGRFISLAHDVNSGMPRYIASHALKILQEKNPIQKDFSILIVGISYKKNVSDTRESASLDVIKNLQNLGANVTVYDPVATISKEDCNFSVTENLEKSLEANDATLILTDHDVIDWNLIANKSAIVFDTRKVIKGDAENVYRL